MLLALLPRLSGKSNQVARSHWSKLANGKRNCPSTSCECQKTRPKCIQVSLIRLLTVHYDWSSFALLCIANPLVSWPLILFFYPKVVHAMSLGVNMINSSSRILLMASFLFSSFDRRVVASTCRLKTCKFKLHLMQGGSFFWSAFWLYSAACASISYVKHFFLS